MALNYALGPFDPLIPQIGLGILQAMLREAFSKLNQVKVNFTPVRLSAMEDFIARGDRRIATVRR